MTNARFFSYKSPIYEPNFTKLLTNINEYGDYKSIAAHKPCEFQEYRLKKSPQQGEKVAKISMFGENRFTSGDAREK